MNTIDYYNQNADQFYQSTIDLDMTDLYQPFLDLIPDGGQILDAGCGSGRDSLYFIQKGYKVTAFDASKALVKLSSKLINQKVLPLSFQDLIYNNKFDGIWACASLLHVEKNQIENVFIKLKDALKQAGILYASFKYGDKEFERDGRLFNSYNEKLFEKLIDKIPNLNILRIWQTTDCRPGRIDELWLNALLKKEPK